MYHTTADQVAIYYEVHGQSGSPLLMLTGMGGDIGDWLPEHIEQLSRQHQVILVDNRGAGRSDKPITPYTMSQFAEDTVGVLTDLQIEQAHILGGSLGGMIAQHVAVNYPERVTSLILCCTTAVAPGHPAFVPPAPEVFTALTRPPSGNRVQDVEDGWQLCFTPAFIKQNPELFNRLRANALAYPDCPPHAQQLQFEAIVHSHNLYEQVRQLACPTLVQVGAQDLLLPAENSHTLACLIPSARLIEYPDCGHRLIEERGERVINDILAFLAEVDNRARLTTKDLHQ